MRYLIIFCFLYPFVFNGLNLQGWLLLYVSSSIAQLMAYLNLGFIMIGIFLIIKKVRYLSKTASVWFYFFIVYYVLALTASIINNNSLEFIKSLVPVIYYLGFMLFLSTTDNLKLFEKTATLVFVIANIALIIFVQLNFDYDYYNVDLEYDLDRAQGLYGDANNAALVAIVAIVFLNRVVTAKGLFLKTLKIMLFSVMFYALFLTFSTTGFAAFTIAVVLLNYKLFTKDRILLAMIVLPIFYVLILNINILTDNLDLNIRQQHKIDNIVNLLSFDFENVDSSGRDDLVAHLMNYVYEKPFFGNGLDFGNQNSGHNTLIAIWADGGIIALLMFLYLLYVYYKNSILAPPKIRYFSLPILITMCMFMLSLQSVINQPYLMCVFVYLGYLIDNEQNHYA